jgi:hypothetical protein
MGIIISYYVLEMLNYRCTSHRQHKVKKLKPGMFGAGMHLNAEFNRVKMVV